MAVWHPTTPTVRVPRHRILWPHGCMWGQRPLTPLHNDSYNCYSTSLLPLTASLWVVGATLCPGRRWWWSFDPKAVLTSLNNTALRWQRTLKIHNDLLCKLSSIQVWVKSREILAHFVYSHQHRCIPLSWTDTAAMSHKLTFKWFHWSLYMESRWIFMLSGSFNMRSWNRLVWMKRELG